MKEGQKSIYYITGGAEVPAAHLAPARDLQEEGHRSPDPRRRDRRDRLLRHRQVRRHRPQGRQQGLHQRRPEGRSRARDKRRSPQAAARQAQGHARRSRQGRARLRAARRQPLLHRLRRRGALAADAADAARHGPEGHPRAQAHARDQPRSRDRQEAARRARTTRITEDAAWLLFDQALLMEGVPLQGPRRLRAAPQPRPEPLHLATFRCPTSRF